MNSLTIKALSLALVCTVAWAGDPDSGQGGPTTANALESDNDKVLYSLGYELGKDIGRQELKLVPEVLLRGAEDALAGEKPVVSRREHRLALKQIKDGRAAANLEQAQAFLAENAQKDGVQTLPSGLQYRVIQPGDGEMPGAKSKVRVHYRGRLLDGTEFDSSYARDRPATFLVNKVIKGWREALQLMREGAQWALFIPPDLAYGVRGRPPTIPPNSLLRFEVELLKLVPPDPPKRPARAPGVELR